MTIKMSKTQGKQKICFLLTTFIYFSSYSTPICRGQSSLSTVSYTDRKRRKMADGFISKMENTGHATAEGYIYFSEMESCEETIAQGGTCSGTNPASSYGYYVIPEIEDEFTPDVDEPLEDRLVARIRGDEAIVLIGRTPPESAYYGYTHYLTFRTKNSTTHEFVSIEGSLSDTLNLVNLKLNRPVNAPYEHSFDKDVIIVTTAHRDTFDAVRKTLIEEGFSPDIINLQVISPELFKLGLERDADTIALLNRVTLFKNETEGAEYLNNTPAIILRVTPNEEKIITQPYKMPERSERVMDTNEIYLEETLDALEASVLEAYSPYIIKPKSVIVKENAIFGEECILNETNCMYDNSDATYLYVDGPFTLSGDQFYVSIGVDHMRSNTGAMYSNVAVNNPSTEVGVADFNSINDMDGSTHAYLSEEYEHRNSLYATTIRRNCTGYQFCMEVGYGDLGLPEEERPRFNFRTYLHKDAAVGPPVESLLFDRVYFVDPSSEGVNSVSKMDELANGMLRGRSSIKKL